MLHIIPVPPYYKMSPLKDPTLAAQIVFGLVILIIALHLALPRFVNNSFHIIPVPPYYHIVPVLLHHRTASLTSHHRTATRTPQVCK